MNRGSAVRSGVQDRFLFASMRPRFMNRGSLDQCACFVLSLDRFNEAPIHESGKWSSRRGYEGLRLGFNEAPIHESGKSASSRCVVD